MSAAVNQLSIRANRSFGAHRSEFGPSANSERDRFSSQWSSELNGRKIVVIDDLLDMRRLIGRFLSRAGADVFTAATAEDARTLLREVQPDAIICDIAMPDEDGLAFMRQLRRSENRQGIHTPAMALTAITGLEYRSLALQAGFEAHLCKPITSDVLITHVARLISGRNSRQ